MQILWRRLEREPRPSRIELVPELEVFVTRLEQIATKNPKPSSGFFEGEAKGTARQIGAEINEQYGIEGMRHVYYRVMDRLGKLPAQHLERVWNNVGEWRA